MRASLPLFTGQGLKRRCEAQVSGYGMMYGFRVLYIHICLCNLIYIHGFRVPGLGLCIYMEWCVLDTHTHTHTRTHGHTHTRTHAHMHKHTHTHTHTPTHPHMHTRTHAHTHTRTHAHTHTPTHPHTHTPTPTHRQIQAYRAIAALFRQSPLRSRRLQSESQNRTL